MKNIYQLDGIWYEFDYQDCKQKYETFCKMSDEDFLKNITRIGHLACHITWFKGVSYEDAINDNGIIHSLWHIAQGVQPHQLNVVRKKFEDECRLC